MPIVEKLILKLTNNLKFNFNELDYILTELEPIITKFISKEEYDSIDLDVLSNINVEEIISSGKKKLLDLCTGSGCIAISLANRFRDFPAVNFYASDISEKALKVAKENASNLNTDIDFICSAVIP